MPRKSLAGSSSTPTTRPKRPAPSPLSESLARKRRRRGITPTPPAEDAESPDINGETIVAAPVSAVLAAAAAAAGDSGEVYDSEKELEAWQDFAAEHYEMVEQLPLELHRNFRLLRELDDGCIAQTKRLQALMRDYISQRLLLLEHFKISNLPEPEPSSVPRVGAGTSPGDQPLELTHTIAQPHKTAADETADSADELAVDRDVAASPLPPFISGPTDVPGQADESEPPAPPLPGGETREGDGEPHPESLGVPVPDGQGGLLLPPTLNGNSGMVSMQRHGVDLNETPGRLEFPHPVEEEEAQAQDVAPGASSRDGDVGRRGVGVSLKLENPAEKRPLPLPYLLLPEIGKLAKEMVRNGEEKVAVAVGAYNSIDRHIRALDSALSAQEASILLGLRPSTLPSLAVDEAMHLNMGEHDVHQKTEDEEVTIGLGGGRKGRKGRNEKKKKQKKKGEEGEGQERGQGQIPGMEDGGGGVGSAGGPGGVGATGHEEGPPFDLEADPNEPRYCTCNRVSFGQMIACDNGDDCPIEWFHYGCVSLTSEPTGKWLCPVCRPRPGHHLGGHGLGSGTGTGEVKVAPKKGRVVPKGAQRRRR